MLSEQYIYELLIYHHHQMKLIRTNVDSFIYLLLRNTNKVIELY